MADIQAEIEKIRTAVYGEEVRGAIVSSLTEINSKKPDEEEVIKNASGTVSSANLASSSVTSAKISSGAVSKSKLSTELQFELDGKANVADVEAALGNKANTDDVEAELALKANSSDVTKSLRAKQNAQYSGITITNIDDFIALNQTDTVYTGRMQGFSKKFGELSDTVVKGFRMWFVLSGADNPTWYRIVLFDDGAVWTALRSGTAFTQRSYTKNQVDKLLGEKADTADVNRALNLKANFADVQAALAGKAYKSTTLAGYNIGDAYTKTEVENLISNAVNNIVTVLYLSDSEEALIAGKKLTYTYTDEELTLSNVNEDIFQYDSETLII